MTLRVKFCPTCGIEAHMDTTVLPGDTVRFGPCGHGFVLGAPDWGPPPPAPRGLLERIKRALA
jgi:hypothetical protein